MAPLDTTASRDDLASTGTGTFVANGATWLARRERWLWIGATLALLADLATTLLGLQLGLAEGNPVVANALSTFGIAGFLTVKAGVLVVAYGARLALPRYRVAIPLGVALPWLVAAGTNATLLVLAA
jgi:hypothetical protein